MPTLTHIDKTGAAHMVDVGEKSVTERIAVAESIVIMQPETLKLIFPMVYQRVMCLQPAALLALWPQKKPAI
mgnify:CR=1 FL=1